LNISNLQYDNPFEELGIGVEIEKKPLRIIEIEFESLKEYYDSFHRTLDYLSDLDTRLITIVSEPVPLKLPIQFNQHNSKSKKLIITEPINPKFTEFLIKYLSENEFRNSEDFLCIGKFATWEAKSIYEFQPVKFDELKGLFFFSEDRLTMNSLIYEKEFETSYMNFISNF